MTTIMNLFYFFVLFLSLTAIGVGAAQEDSGDDDTFADLTENMDNETANELNDISEIIFKTNENLKGVTDGDIAPPLKRNASPCTSTGCKWRKYGRHVTIPYYIHRSYSSRERSTIVNAMHLFNRQTCVRFIERRWWHRFWYRYWDYIYFVPARGCWSYVGRQRGKQYISLQRPGCVYPGVVQHEILHALGFHHEQSRSDRDRYVTINYFNIQSGKASNFRKVRTNNLATSYNYNSVMHYKNYDFSRNGRPTIVAKYNPNRRLGSSYITMGDITRVKRLYRCW